MRVSESWVPRPSLRRAHGFRMNSADGSGWQGQKGGLASGPAKPPCGCHDPKMMVGNYKKYQNFLSLIQCTWRSPLAPYHSAHATSKPTRRLGLDSVRV